MADFRDDPSLRDIEYGLDAYDYQRNYGGLTYDDIEDYSEEEMDKKIEEVKADIKEEAQLAEADIIKDIDDTDFLSKKERSAFKRVVSKRINKTIKEFSKEADNASEGSGRFDIDDIGEKLDDELDKIKESVNEMLDVDEYGYNNIYGRVMPKANPYKKGWNNTTQTKVVNNNYSSGIKEVDSDRKIKIKIDKESLDAFLSESDGDNENIGIIIADNREFSDIEDVTFGIVKVEDNVKKRQGAYTEADGKAISDYAQEHGLTKCGWIHTHPFTKNSTVFSGLDKTTTKEMCVLPDDYCLAVVVGCEYKEVNNYMKDDGKIVKEYDLEYNLGRMTYRKVELENEKYDGKTDSIEKECGFVMVKYDCEIVTVDKDGNVVEEL